MSQGTDSDSSGLEITGILHVGNLLSHTVTVKDTTTAVDAARFCLDGIKPKFKILFGKELADVKKVQILLGERRHVFLVST